MERCEKCKFWTTIFDDGYGRCDKLSLKKSDIFRTLAVTTDTNEEYTIVMPRKDFCCTLFQQKEVKE